MSEIVYEILCESCGADYELNYLDSIDKIIEGDEPIYCPFCSADIEIPSKEDGEKTISAYDFDV
jgi:hypothetical protein